MPKEDNADEAVGKNSSRGFSTRAIHIGQEPNESTGAIMPPIELTTIYEWEDLGEEKAHSYTRYSNSNRLALETCVANLEVAKHAYAFSSGIASIDSVFRLLAPGDHVVLGGMVYGGTIKLLKNIYSQLGITFDITDIDNGDGSVNVVDAIGKNIKDNTKMILVESPANPYFNIVDIEAVVELAKSGKQEILCVADNTVATPYLQNPLSMGVDMVVHSASKYMGGHSDILGGVVVLNNDELAERIHGIQISAGAVLSPFNSYLTLRGLRTLGVRMDRQTQNAMAIASMLQAHKKVLQVNYAGLKSHPSHSLAKKQMKDFGAMMSVVLDGDRRAISKFVKNVKVITFSESLGAVETLISNPNSMSHVPLTGTEYEIPHNLVRISVGIEDEKDLLEDLDQALSMI